jgi:hypothetical protein
MISPTPDSNFTAPTPANDPTILNAKRESEISNINSKLKIASVLGITGYGIYKVGKLPDTFKGERGLVISAIALSGIGWLSTIDFSGKSHTNRFIISTGVAAASIGYLGSRVIFKQNVKKSLLLSSIFLIGTVFYMKEKINSNNTNTGLK